MTKKEKKSLKELTGFGTGNRVRQAITVIVGGSIAIVLVTGGFDQESSETASEEPAVQEEETEEVAEAEAEEEPEELSVEEQLIQSAEEHMGNDFIQADVTNGTNFATITSNVDGVTVGLDKSSAHSDVADVLKDVQQMDGIETVYFEMMGSIIDAAGNSSEEKVLTYEFKEETIDEINFDNFNSENAPVMADSYWEHHLYADEE